MHHRKVICWGQIRQLPVVLPRTTAVYHKGRTTLGSQGHGGVVERIPIAVSYEDLVAYEPLFGSLDGSDRVFGNDGVANPRVHENVTGSNSCRPGWLAISVLHPISTPQNCDQQTTHKRQR